MFTGELSYANLPALYSCADLFVFPSNTDTFGMVVLEAQSCGLPAVVLDQGGPQEIILDGESGAVARADHINEWCSAVERIIRLKGEDPEKLRLMQNTARRNVVDMYNWTTVLDKITEVQPETVSAAKRCQA